MNNRIFVFDVDGTLTPSRSTMDSEFKQFFDTFCLNNPVYLVTGSDRPKTVEQLTESTYKLCKRVYQCSGNDVYEGNQNIRANSWKLPHSAYVWLEDALEQSDFSIRTGNHIDVRPGMVNFSILGRNASVEQRKAYVTYETKHNERRFIADLFNARFGEYGIVANVAGDTGIDIQPIGADKAQIVPELIELNPNADIFFYGDKTQPGGNDHTIASALLELGHAVFPVDSWKDTFTLLKNTVEN